MRPRFFKPSLAAIERFLAGQAGALFTYQDVGATRGPMAPGPAGYVVDRTRVFVGTGDAAFERARSAMVRWDHFALGWVEAHPAGAQIAVGMEVAVIARTMGVWWMNACRVVYVVDEVVDGVRRWGFAYGTLLAHAERGEERFLIEQSLSDGAVHYDIVAFSRPRFWLAKFARPITRMYQRRFARDSAAAMVRAVGSGDD